MIEKRLFWVLLLISQFTFSQIKGVVKDSLTGNPIPYVNIWVENENIGTTSEEDGTFELKASKEKKLVFSALGFETKICKLSETSEIILNPIVYRLDNVEITKLKNTKELEIGDSKKRFYLPEPQTTPWIFARKFTSEYVELKFIKNLIFYTNSEVEKGIFRVRVFNVGQKDIPSEDILTEELLVEVKKGKHKTIVDVLKYKIKIPNEGIIVGFESLIIEQNKYMQKAITFGTKKRTEYLNYSPHIMYFYDDAIDNYSYRLGRWLLTKSIHKKKYKPEYRFPNPAINITLTN